MSQLEILNGNLALLRQSLDAAEMDPDPNRSDFETHAEALNDMADRIETGVLDILNEALLELHDDAERAKAKSIAAALTVEVACLLYAAGKRDKVSLLFSRARSVDPAGPKATLLSEIERDYTVMVRLNRAEWLTAQNRRGDGERIARELTGLRAFPETAKWAKSMLEAPKPIKSAPGLYTLNGVGTSLWGKRDKRPDGTYIATRCFVFIFLPVFAIDAYRVRYEGGNSYLFFNKVPLSNFAQWWRRLLVSAMLAAAVSAVVQSYRNSPERQLARAFQTATAAEQTAHTDADRPAVLKQYRDILAQFGWSDSPQVKEAALAVLRLETMSVPKPLRLTDTAQAHRIFAQFSDFPTPARQATGGTMAGLLVQWSKELESADQSRLLHERIKLLDAALSLPETTIHTEAAALKNATVLQWAKLLESSRPMDAVHRYLTVADNPEAVRAAAQVLRRLKDMPGVRLDVEQDAVRFADAVRANNLRDLETEAAALNQVIQEDAAAAALPERIALLQSEAEKPLAAALKQSPRDQGIAVSLAGLVRLAGRASEALAILESARGENGVFSRWAELNYIDCLIDLERLEDAGKLLEAILDARLAAYLDIATRFSKSADEMENRLVTDANAGLLPKAFQAKLDGTPKAEQQGIFSAWLNEQMTADPALNTLRAQFLDMWDVVPAALKLGAVNLQRAADASGADKTRLLGAAEAAYLSVKTEAETDPEYHIGLGRVYYRLGKSEQGDREFASVLNQNDPRLSLSAAYAYRELGLFDKAFSVAKTVYESAESPLKENAAQLAAVSAPDRDEKETWLRKSDLKSTQVIAGLLELEGDKLVEQGDIPAADEKYKEAERVYTKEGKSNNGSLNNAALTARRRYEITGDMTHIDRAVGLLEKVAVHLPESALVQSNLAQILKQRAELKILASFVRLEALKLTADEGSTMLTYLLEGATGDAVRAQLRASKDIGRSLSLLKQTAVLAPKFAAAYRAENEIAVSLDNVEMLQQLRDRIAAQNGIPDPDKAASRADWLSGKHDARTRENLSVTISRAEKEIAALRKLNHPPTLAAGLIKVAWAHHYLSYLEDPAKHLAAAANAFKEAASLWNESGAAYGLTGVLSAQAILGASAANPTVLALWNTERRTLSDAALIARAWETDPAGVSAALAARPEMQALVPLLAAENARPGVLAVAVSNIAETPALAAAAENARNRKTVALALDIAALLDPADPDVQMRRKLFGPQTSL